MLMDAKREKEGYIDQLLAEMQANATKRFEKDEGPNERQCSGDRMKLPTALIAVYLSTAPVFARMTTITLN